eukprot:GCRY01000671.1.p1 GENE.GCRY01000671.1~~GCRY01000671.1.p1  ORF type:complete len:138 (+),score=22.45 GCRY01000671.1:104-517(+)
MFLIAVAAKLAPFRQPLQRGASVLATEIHRNFGSFNFISREGEEIKVPIEDGQNLVEACEDADVFIDSRCGGNQMCGGCACHVHADWIEKVNVVSPMEEDEEERLVTKFKPQVPADMRLSCGIVFTPELEGLIVTHH